MQAQVVCGERKSPEPMMNKYRLMSPGPTPIPPEVSAAGALPIIHHRTPEFGEVFTRVNENLKRVFLTENDVFTYAASGTGAFEGAIQNLFSPGDKVLVVNNGNFGNRWVKMSRAFGLDRKSTRLNSSHANISYAVFCLKKKDTPNP